MLGERKRDFYYVSYMTQVSAENAKNHKSWGKLLGEAIGGLITLAVVGGVLAVLINALQQIH